MQNTLFITGATVGSIEGVSHIPSGSETIDIIKVVIQLIVGVVGLIKMFKKPKEVKQEENTNK